MCTTQLEFETVSQEFSLEATYALSLLLIGLIINKVGLFTILCKYSMQLEDLEKYAQSKKQISRLIYSLSL